MRELQDKPYDTPEPNVRYAITAEFDNKYGPTLKYQYPSCIPGFNSVTGNKLGNDSKYAFHLASLMLPSNVEQKLSSSADYTVFILYFNSSTECYELFPTANSGLDDALFFISAVIAQEDTKDSRGAKIKAMALGTKLKFFNSFKPAILQLLQNLMRYDTYETTMPFLIDIYQSINSIDLSYIQKIHENKVLQNIFGGVDSDECLRNLLDYRSDARDEVLQYLGMPDQDRYGNRIRMMKGHLVMTYDAYIPREPFKNFKRNPLVVDMVRGTPIDIEIKYCDLIAKFMIKLIPLLRKKSPENFSFKIIVHSDVLPKNAICQFVLALSTLMNCFTSQKKSKYYENGLIAIFPYMEVSMMDPIKSYFASLDCSHHFIIMGTANPIFKLQQELWDLFYDIDKDILLEPNQEKTLGLNRKWDSMSIRKMLNRNSTISISTADSEYEICLLSKFFEVILQEKPSNATTISLLKKLNFFQLLHKDYFRDDETMFDDAAFNDYLITYKDFVIFDDFFNDKTFKVARLLDNLSEVIDKLFAAQDAPQDTYQPFNATLLPMLNNTLNEIYRYLLSGNKNLEIFMSTCMCYPFVTAETNTYSLMNPSSSSNNKKESVRNFGIDNSWLRLVDDNSRNSVIETFQKDRSLCLFILPLLFNPEPKEKPRVYVVPEEVPSNDFNERPKSLAFKWMFNLGNNKSMENSIDSYSLQSGSEAYSISSVPTSKLISTTLSNNSSLSAKIDHEELKHQITTSRNLSLKILQLIENHVIGKALLKNNLPPYFFMVFRCMKSQQRNDFANYEARLSETEDSFRSVLYNNHTNKDKR